MLYRRIQSAFPKFQVFIKEIERNAKKRKRKNMKVRYAVRVFAIKDDKIMCIRYKDINKIFDILVEKLKMGKTLTL